MPRRMPRELNNSPVKVKTQGKLAHFYVWSVVSNDEGEAEEPLEHIYAHHFRICWNRELSTSKIKNFGPP